ncbi:hypothetical protein AJE_14140 [Alishewanella jeotgali KCTC 22429]|uniref:Uncharacterized protein n=1 Tax=Alishewanella jeotgali KCTC 22429 TaxID=1129374 RepID=H3ZHH0_9ALTE|nr:hypothetical protein AJE_14140 [Alishewanella jeotgali KCTC 22429]
MLWQGVFVHLIATSAAKYLFKGNFSQRMIMVCKQYVLYTADAFCSLLTADSEFIKLFRKSG